MTTDDEDSSVVQVMVAPVVVIAVAVTAEMTGSGVNVRKVLLVEVVDWLAAFAEMTAKSYVVLCVSPMRVTEWEVDSVLFTVVDVPYPVVVP